MSVYFGSSGCVELQRDSGRSEMLASRLDVVDVNMERRRFSVDFALGALITGDEIHIYTLDYSPLYLVEGHQEEYPKKAVNGWFPGELSCKEALDEMESDGAVVSQNGKEVCLNPDEPNESFRPPHPPDNVRYSWLSNPADSSSERIHNAGLFAWAGMNDQGSYYPDWRGYCHVDLVGGIRLYDNFADSIDGTLEKALPLIQTDSPRDIIIKTDGQNVRTLSQITSYELATSRELVNTTTLGEEFTNQFKAGLINGQGTLDCLWEFKKELCDPMNCLEGEIEFPVYLAQLCLRLKQGAAFRGRFYVHRGNDKEQEQSVWYFCEQCMVTNASVTVEGSSAIRTTVQFITTGEILLQVGIPEIGVPEI